METQMRFVSSEFRLLLFSAFTATRTVAHVSLLIYNTYFHERWPQHTTVLLFYLLMNHLVLISKEIAANAQSRNVTEKQWSCLKLKRLLHCTGEKNSDFSTIHQRHNKEHCTTTVTSRHTILFPYWANSFVCLLGGGRGWMAVGKRYVINTSFLLSVSPRRKWVSCRVKEGRTGCLWVWEGGVWASREAAQHKNVHYTQNRLQFPPAEHSKGH